MVFFSFHDVQRSVPPSSLRCDCSEAAVHYSDRYRPTDRPTDRVKEEEIDQMRASERASSARAK